MRKSKKNFVGILGGTFNPPHKGHIFISNYALKRLNLGEIWWIVTKKNPLKKTKKNFQKRSENVKNFVTNRNIKIMEMYALLTLVKELLIKDKFMKPLIWLLFGTFL